MARKITKKSPIRKSQRLRKSRRKSHKRPRRRSRKSHNRPRRKSIRKSSNKPRKSPHRPRRRSRKSPKRPRRKSIRKSSNKPRKSPKPRLPIYRVRKAREGSKVSGCRDNESFCNAIGSFSKQALNELYSYVPLQNGNENEVAGPLILKRKQSKWHDLPSYQIDVVTRGVKGGDGNEVDAIPSKYNFHSHPEAAYMAHRCELGWPSRDDYITFLDGFFKFETTFHVIATKEGLYILKINPCVIKKLKVFYNALGDDQEKFINNVDDWADEFINISKVGLTRARGKKAPKTGEIIKTPAEYVNFVNDVRCDEIECGNEKLVLRMPIFDIEYISWDDADADIEKSSFIFTIEKSSSGKCKIS